MKDSNREGQELKAWLIYDEERAAANRFFIQMHYETGGRYGRKYKDTGDRDISV